MSDPPRILHLDDGLQWRGGQHQVYLLLRELAALGIEQWLAAAPESPLAARAREAGIRVLPLRMRGELDWRAPRRIAAWARELGIDIIHAHTSHAHALGLRAARGLDAGVRMLSTRRVDFPVGRGFFSRRKYTRPDQHFIAISGPVRQVLIDGGVAPERIDLVHSGVPAIDPAQCRPRAGVRCELGIGDDEIAIVNIGALTDHKGQRWLIEAAPAVLRDFPAARFHILGEGELREMLTRQIRALGLEERVILHGFVADARLKLAGFDLFVSSSHLEGLGTVILDAMLAGLPVVAAAAGGVTDVVLDGQTGHLAPVRDAASLARTIGEALRETALTRDMRDRARDRVMADFSARAMAEGTLHVYRKLLA